MNNDLLIIDCFPVLLKLLSWGFFLSFDLHVSCHKHLFQFLIIIKLFCQNIAIILQSFIWRHYRDWENKNFWFLLVMFYFDEINKKCDHTNFRWKLQINFMNIIWIIFQGNASVLDKREPYLYFLKNHRLPCVKS